MEWTPVNKGIITARFYFRFRRLLVIQVYAPLNEKEEDEELQQTIDGCKETILWW